RARVLEHLVMPPLKRTSALAQMDDVAVPIGQDLEFDVMRSLDILFKEDDSITEGSLGFQRSDVYVLAKFGIRPHHPKAASSSACAGFNDDGIAGTFCK